MGDSDHPETGYDLKTVAADIHALVTSLNLAKDGPIDVADHDVGTWMSYAYASSYPQDIRRLILFDAALPGVTQLPSGVPSDTNNVKSWHFSFNRLDDLPEILVSGHERAYLAWLFAHKMTKQWALTPADLDEYVRVFEKPGAVRASFSYYRSDNDILNSLSWPALSVEIIVATTAYLKYRMGPEKQLRANRKGIIRRAK